MNRQVFIKKLLMSVLSFSFLSFSAKKRDTCYTDSDVEGPFFRSGSPSRLNLSEGFKGRGKNLTVEGIIYGKDCKTPIENALIEIWHANPEGNYDLTSDKYLFRGKIYTDKMGRYSFETLIPKGYKDGGLDRPKHIHYMIEATGHQTLITQLYFQGDEKLKNDPFVLQNKGYKRTKQLTPISSNEFKIRFDIYLKSKI